MLNDHWQFQNLVRKYFQLNGVRYIIKGCGLHKGLQLEGILNLRSNFRENLMNPSCLPSCSDSYHWTLASKITILQTSPLSLLPMKTEIFEVTLEAAEFLEALFSKVQAWHQKTSSQNPSATTAASCEPVVQRL